MFDGLLFKMKSTLHTLAAVILVLVGIHPYGGYMARRSMEEKERREDNKRLQSTVEVVNETNSEVPCRHTFPVHRELHDKWMRHSPMNH
ncbi:hypothetical protein QM042_01775 [Escherichia coli]